MYTETIEEFSRKHPGPPVLVNEVLTFADGATIDNRSVSAGFPAAFAEPPADAYRNAMFRLQYREEFLRLISEAFTRLKELIHAGQGHGWLSQHWNAKLFGPMPGDGKGCLLRLKKLSDEQRAAIDEIESEIEQLPQVRRQRREEAEREQRDAAAREAELVRRSEIQKITL